MDAIPAPSKVDFLDVTDTQLIKSTTPTDTKKPIQNFVKVGEEYWKQKDLLSSYQKGLFFGRGDASNIYLSEFIKKFRKLFEDMVREELKKNDHTFESFKDDFKTLEFLFNMIFTHINIKQIDLKDEKNIAILHGFMNAYVDSLNYSP
jgi:hypothetical protein